ncbi:Panacea domain-containing protein [Bacillus mojavensis]
MTASDIAKFFISLSKPGTSNNITNLKLQKILYYAQGKFLALKGKPLFEEEIEAWVHGPVVPEVYHEYKKFGYSDIKPPENDEIIKNIDPELKAFLEKIWKEYKDKTGKELEEATHNEDPWKDARNGLPDFISSNAKIPKRKLKDFFITAN